MKGKEYTFIIPYLLRYREGYGTFELKIKSEFEVNKSLIMSRIENMMLMERDEGRWSILKDCLEVIKEYGSYIWPIRGNQVFKMIPVKVEGFILPLCVEVSKDS